MYDNDKNRSNYQGMFAWRPDRTERGVWGTTEIHHRTFGPNVKVTRDWYGNVTGIDRSWF
jgi:hypothetical protein